MSVELKKVTVATCGGEDPDTGRESVRDRRGGAENRGEGVKYRRGGVRYRGKVSDTGWEVSDTGGEVSDTGGRCQIPGEGVRSTVRSDANMSVTVTTFK